jgi:hypothetical protein
MRGRFFRALMLRRLVTRRWSSAGWRVAVGDWFFSSSFFFA